MQFKNLKFTEEKILKLLESLDFHNIKSYEKEIKFSWSINSNPNGCCLFKNSLYFTYWSKNLKGDLIELIKNKLECTYRESFLFLERFMKEKINGVVKKQETCYSKFIAQLESMQEEDDYDVYDEKILCDYRSTVSELFLQDGIGSFSQFYFGIVYDPESTRIGIPIRDIHGDLVGVLGRYNKKHVDGNSAKYLPIIPYKKHLFLFGLYENMKSIKEDKTLYIVESEKSVLRAFSLGFRNVVALGTCRVNHSQKALIEELGVEKVVLLLDEGLEDDYYKSVANSLISNSKLFAYNVFYINANDCGLGRKNCIFDEDEEKIKYILNNKLLEVEYGNEQ